VEATKQKEEIKRKKPKPDEQEGMPERQDLHVLHLLKPVFQSDLSAAKV
jgi:hypothetical protein